MLMPSARGQLPLGATKQEHAHIRSVVDDDQVLVPGLGLNMF